MSASRTARLVASLAAQLLREPVLGACRYVRNDCPSTQASDTALMISSRDSPSICATTAVEATLTSTTWSRPTLLKEFSSAMQPWISWALTIATSTSATVSGFFPAATALRLSQSAVARMPPRLSEG
jgi:hypothetical protein